MCSSKSTGASIATTRRARCGPGSLRSPSGSPPTTGGCRATASRSSGRRPRPCRASSRPTRASRPARPGRSSPTGSRQAVDLKPAGGVHPPRARRVPDERNRAPPSRIPSSDRVCIPGCTPRARDPARALERLAARVPMVTGNRDPLDRRARDALDAEKAAVVAPAGASARVLSRLRVSGRRRRSRTRRLEEAGRPRECSAAGRARSRSRSAAGSGRAPGRVARGATIPPAPPRIASMWIGRRSPRPPRIQTRVRRLRPHEREREARPAASLASSRGRSRLPLRRSRTPAAAPSATSARSSTWPTRPSRAAMDPARSPRSPGTKGDIRAARCPRSARPSPSRRSCCSGAPRRRARGARSFRDRFPTSLSGPAVDAALASIGR